MKDSGKPYTVSTTLRRGSAKHLPRRMGLLLIMRQPHLYFEEFCQAVSEFGMAERAALIFNILVGKMWVTWYCYENFSNTGQKENGI